MSRDINVTFPNNDTFKKGIPGGPVIMLSSFVEQDMWDQQLEKLYDVATQTKFTNFDDFKQYIKNKYYGEVSLYDPPGTPVKKLDIDLFNSTNVPYISINDGTEIATDWTLAEDPCAKSGNCGYGKIEMADVNEAIKNAGYIKQAECPSHPKCPKCPKCPTPPSIQPKDCKENLWNQLSITMTCVGGILFISIIIILIMLKKKSSIKK